jgi:oxygen-independent coproporphyrinogen-3 oxidase
LKKLGVNRLSIGIQSFDPEILTYLGRKHSKEQALLAIQNAQNTGFDNVSIDLIYGIPLRSSEVWKQELELTFQQPITHLSAYSLTIEENSLLRKALQKKDGSSYKVGKDQDDEKAFSDLNILLNFTNQFGFEQYEVSNFASKGFHSIHNSNYWNFTPYLGFGPSAHSYYNQSRSWNESSLNKYIAAVKEGIIFLDREELSLVDQYNERIMLGLRTKNGVDIDEIEKKYGEMFKQHLLHILHTLPLEFYSYNENKLVLTQKGLNISDYIIEKMIWTED